jgi:hypothetical protein
MMIHVLDKKFLAPLLRGQGFKKKNLTWNRTNVDIVHVLDIQLSRFSNLEEIQLTVNIGICMHAVRAIYWGKEIPSFIEEIDCFPRFRIGKFLSDFQPDALDRWWSLRNKDDIDKVGRELQVILSERVIPFLNRITTMPQVKIFCDANPLHLFPADKLNFAILDYLMDDRVGYHTFIAEFSDKKLAAWQPKLSDIVGRLEKVK